VHVPYKGSVLALNDMIVGQLQFIITSPVNAMPHWKTGRIKVVATAGARADPLMPELPTIAKTLPGFQSTQWWGVAAPVKTPAVIVKRLNVEIVKALQSAEMLELLARQGGSARVESAAEFTAFTKAERGRIGRVGRQAGITLD
jgi:tripartite-type tricarboxylate transporter receptor subunit TctC